jgi:hypothetical protein
MTTDLTTGHSLFAIPFAPGQGCSSASENDGRAQMTLPS